MGGREGGREGRGWGFKRVASNLVIHEIYFFCARNYMHFFES